jgi:hypothetical protein
MYAVELWAQAINLLGVGMDKKPCFQENPDLILGLDQEPCQKASCHFSPHPGPPF